MASKSTRDPNWTAEECKKLSQLYTEYSAVLSTTKFDSQALEKKRNAWKTITEQLNNCYPDRAPRNVDKVKKKWDNLIGVLKKEKSTERKAVTGTGGGPKQEDTVSDVSEEVDKALGKPTKVHGIPGGLEVGGGVPADEVVKQLDVDMDDVDSPLVEVDNKSIDVVKEEIETGTPTPALSAVARPSKRRLVDTRSEDVDVKRVRLECLNLEKVKLSEEIEVLRMKKEYYSLRIMDQRRIMGLNEPDSIVEIDGKQYTKL